MAIMEKYIFTNFNDLKTYLISKGFTFTQSNNEWHFKWKNWTANCYWYYNTQTQTGNFKASNGTTVFRKSDIIDFSEGDNCGCIFLSLADDGCMLYLTPVNTDFSINQLYPCCSNNAHAGGNLVNGIVVCTPPEEGENSRCRYSWRYGSGSDEEISKFQWCVDNTINSFSIGTEVPFARIINFPMNVSIVRAYLNTSGWSKYIFYQVLGTTTIPGQVFKIQGQKYISFSDTNNYYRVPVFKLAPEELTINDSGSTELYSSTKTYKVNDYCIYNDQLWRCTTAVTRAMPFDDNYWTITTVTAEKSRV